MATIKRYRGGTAYDIAYAYDERKDFLLDEFTKVLLHFDESATKDECKGTCTAYGNPTLSTDTKKFGASSCYFNGSSRIEIPNFDLADKDFTFDHWIYFSAVGGWQPIFAGITDYRFGFSVTNGKRLYFVSTGSNWNLISGDTSPMNGIGSHTIEAGKWYHFAFTRCGNVWRGFVNGELDLQVTAAGSVVYRNENFNLGRWGYQSYWLNNAYIDEFRVCLGTARWTGDFTPPTAPHTIDDPQVDKNIVLRHDGINRYIPLTTDLSKTHKPCLALRHDGTNYYAIK